MTVKFFVSVLIIILAGVIAVLGFKLKNCAAKKADCSKTANEHGFRTIDPLKFDESLFKLISKDWMLILGEHDGKQNAMTASWGMAGHLWNKHVANVFIRPQRYTKQFIDGAETYSLNFFDESHRDTLNYMGTVSGRNEDKIAKTGLTVVHENGTAYFKEARVVIICRKLYVQQFTPESFVDSSIPQKNYAKNDFHFSYIGGIEKILIK